MKNKKDQNITKNIIKGVFLAGGIVIAATDPKFGYKILPKLAKYIAYKIKNKKDKKKIYDTFYYLKKKDLLNFEDRNGQLHISLTEEGKKKAGKYQIDDLEIKKPKKWDEKWRILIFDIENRKNIKREALRGKIKDLKLFQLQKSVWIYPYDFKQEIDLLRNFFRLSKREMKMIVACEVEEADMLKKIFKFQ